MENRVFIDAAQGGNVGESGLAEGERAHEWDALRSEPGGP